MPVGRVRDQDAADWRGVFEPAGQVDRVADHAKSSPWRPTKWLTTTRPVLTPTRMDKPNAALAELLVPVVSAACISSAARTALRIALLRGRDAEDRHHRIADELLDPAALARDRRRRADQSRPE